MSGFTVDELVRLINAIGKLEPLQTPLQPPANPPGNPEATPTCSAHLSGKTIEWLNTGDWP